MTNEPKSILIWPKLVFLFACLVMSFLDLYLLRGAIHAFLPNDPNQIGASVLSLGFGILGLVIMGFAGYQKATSDESHNFALGVEIGIWILLGMLIASIRVLHAIYYPTNVQGFLGLNVDINDIIFVPILLVLYIGTGTITYRNTEGLFEILHTERYKRQQELKRLERRQARIVRKIAKRRSQLVTIVGSLESYGGVIEKTEKVYQANHKYIDDKRGSAEAMIENAIISRGEFPADVLRQIKKLNGGG